MQDDEISGYLERVKKSPLWTHYVQIKKKNKKASEIRDTRLIIKHFFSNQSSFTLIKIKKYFQTTWQIAKNSL